MIDYRYRGPQWMRRPNGGTPHLFDGTVATLEPEFDWPDEMWVLDHFETHDVIGAEA